MPPSSGANPDRAGCISTVNEAEPTLPNSDGTVDVTTPVASNVGIGKNGLIALASVSCASLCVDLLLVVNYWY